jgi:hypothetical protein
VSIVGDEIIKNILTRQECEHQARARYSSSKSAADTRRTRYEWYHKFYAPVDGDQWPEDLALRPNKLHITANIVKSFVDCESRILSLLPRITNQPPAKDPDSRLKGEVVEELFLRYLEQSEWDVWYPDHGRTKSLYGLGVLHPFWNPEGEGRPDVQVIDQPQNLMLGFGTSDYTVVDWAIYRYEISPLEAMIRYPELVIENPGGGAALKVMRDGERADHQDPLAQRIVDTFGDSIARAVNSRRNQPNEYEDKMVEVWDYWYRSREGDVVNAFLVQGNVVEGPTAHPEMPRIPYIVVENDHEPGSAEAMSTAELLIPLQMGLNRVLSHYAQIVADNSGQAYYLKGENADNVPEGLVPREDEIIAAGAGNDILPIQRNTNSTVNMERLIDTYWATAHKITRLPEILFGAMPGAQTSGRAMAIQIEAAANRIGPMRARDYAGLRQLLQFWGYMLENKNPTITVTRPAEAEEGTPSASEGLTPAPMETFEVKIGDYIKGFNRWKIVAPEITPRDSVENTQNVIAMVNAKLMALKQGMDELGIENPEQMIALIEEERSNARLFPQDVQTYAAVLQLFQAMEAQEMANAAMASQQAAGAATQEMAAQQAATPTKMEDQNQPPTGAGSPPPPGAATPGGVGTFEGLIRQTPGGQAQAMSQIRMKPREF